MDLIQCPICGKMFDPREAIVLENGNIACQNHSEDLQPVEKDETDNNPK